MTAKEFFKQAKPSMSDDMPWELTLMQSYADHCEEAQWIDISLYGFPPARSNDHYSERVWVTDGVDCEVAMYEHDCENAVAWVTLHYCNTPTHWRKLSFPKKDKHEIK